MKSWTCKGECDKFGKPSAFDQTTQVHVDKIASPPRGELRGPIGRLTAEQIRDIDLVLPRHLDIRGHGIE